MGKNGPGRQVLMTFWTRFRWSLVVVNRWSLFRGGRCSEVVVSTGLTVFRKDAFVNNLLTTTKLTSTTLKILTTTTTNTTTTATAIARTTSAKKQQQ